MKILKPEVFQGSLRKRNYFEGWYFKHVSKDGKQVYAFIPGISLSKNDPHAFIQIINGISGETHYLAYPKESFSWEKEKLVVRVGESVFTENYIGLNIQDSTISVQGKLEYTGLSKFPGTLFSPGIMGWYSWVPFMEGYHGVVSANHNISGSISVNSVPVDFNDGKGYIEKDWGTSFPECWIWLQSNSFGKKGVSIFVSIAKIPWFKKYFIGFIAFLFIDGKYYRFATYNRSKLINVNRSGAVLLLELQNKNYRLKATVKTKSGGELIAPVRGNMNRRIKESIDSEVEVELTDNKGSVIFSGESKHAGLEIIDGIFDYL